MESTTPARTKPFPRWAWGLAIFLLATSAMSVAAFVDACDTTAKGHDRAIVVAALSFGGAVFIALWGRVGRWAWIAPATAVIVAVGAVLLLDRLQFGACVS